MHGKNSHLQQSQTFQMGERAGTDGRNLVPKVGCCCGFVVKIPASQQKKSKVHQKFFLSLISTYITPIGPVNVNGNQT